LTRINHPAEQVLQLQEGLSDIERIRLADIFDALKEDRAASEDEEEFRRLLLGSHMVHVTRAPPPWREPIKNRYERMIIEESFGAAFHDLAIQDSTIAVPSYDNELNAYRLSQAYDLLKKHGWVPGEYDCRGILPLDQWSSGDRECLIKFYQWAQPEDPTTFPPGWQTKYIAKRWNPFDSGM